jgi:hypothetical protein
MRVKNEQAGIAISFMLNAKYESLSEAGANGHYAGTALFPDTTPVGSRMTESIPKPKSW